MSKKLMTLISTLLVVGSLGSAYAGDMTLDVYQNGVNVGTMTVPASEYPNVVGRMNGTNVTVRPQPRPDAAARQKAAQDRMNEWKKQDEQRHAAAVAQQDQWNKQFAERQAAAQQRMEDWKKQDEQRRIAAQAKQEQWKQQFDERHAAAQKGYENWKMSR
jgi:hypothetical protein